MNYAEEIARKLLQINAIQLSPRNPFTWASGLRSPIYCDNRVALSYPEVRRLIIEGFAKRSATFRPFELVAGVATAGIAHGALLAERLGLPFAYVREKAKTHGRQNQIEGVARAGQRVLVVEDLISTGGSSLKAVEALREAGCVVAGVLAIFTYGFEHARRAFAEAGCPWAALSDYDTLVGVAAGEGFIEAESLEWLRQWSSRPEAWPPA
jgi:orotate phosphoribosyltransferase